MDSLKTSVFVLVLLFAISNGQVSNSGINIISLSIYNDIEI